MPRKLTNKQLAVLVVIRRHPDGIDANRIAEEITGPYFQCPDCGGTGAPQEADHDDRRRYVESMRRMYDRRPEAFPPGYELPSEEASQCGRCYGNGERRQPYMAYGVAYQAAQRLVKEGLAVRRSKLDEWGDPTQGVVYMPAEVADPDDPLEQMYELPAADGSVRGDES